MDKIEQINKELAGRVMPDIEYIALLNTKVIILQALADKRLEPLKRIEWRPDEMNDYYCPVCYGEKEEGHNFDCELAEAIAEE